MTKVRAAHFAVCLDNEGYQASLEVGKLYRLIPDAEVATYGYIRVVDESIRQRFERVTELRRAAHPSSLVASLKAQGLG